jgi:hypothetical protein
MPHPNSLFDDTSPQVAALIVQHWRETPALQKLAQMSSLNATAQRLALAGLALQYPDESEAQLQQRLYERHYGAALVARVNTQHRDAHARD